MAGSELTANLDMKSYTLFISSNDKVSGTNNNGTYQINWDDFLPREYSIYKTSFSFQSAGGNYKDTQAQAITAATAGTVLTVTAATVACISVGQLLTGSGVTNCYITSYGTGTGGTGTYNISVSQTVASQTMNVTSIYSGCKISMNTLGKSYSFDTSNKSPSFTLGYAQRDIQTSSSSSNSFSTFYLQFPPKTVNRPNQNMITISITNLTNGYPLTDTKTAGLALTDMTPFNLIMEFVPISGSLIKNQAY